MWRANPGRTASVTTELPEKLSVLWSRALEPLKPAYRDVRLQFDRGYEPVVLGQRLFVASSRDDSVTAYATDTGAVLWKIFADGPVRFAPVAGDGRVIFGSDDGVLRCVSAATGELLWQKRAVPNDRQLLGNGRLISVWPIRGGPVLHAGRVYFAAGVWPLEGVFIYCLDAATGREIWLNDRTSYLYGVHPHQAEAFGGVAPQGYLLVDGADLVVPCSSAYPARFDLATGALKDFALPAAGRLPGGWFASTPDEKETQRQKRLGLLFDKEVNAVRHEDKPRAEGTAGVRRSFRAASKEWSFDGPWPGVSGKVHSVLAADWKCFVVTEEGGLYALGDASMKQPRLLALPPKSPHRWTRVSCLPQTNFSLLREPTAVTRSCWAWVNRVFLKRSRTKASSRFSHSLTAARASLPRGRDSQRPGFTASASRCGRSRRLPQGCRLTSRTSSWSRPTRRYRTPPP